MKYCIAHFRYRGSIEYRDTWDSIVVVDPISAFAQHYAWDWSPAAPSSMINRWAWFRRVTWPVNQARTEQRCETPSPRCARLLDGPPGAWARGDELRNENIWRAINSLLELTSFAVCDLCRGSLGSTPPGSYYPPPPYSICVEWCVTHSPLAIIF